MNNFLDQHQEGNVVHWSNVSSCSESFAVWNGSVKTRIVPIGALRTKYLSSYEGSEIENTMKPFPRLKITNVKKEGGETYINITQVG